MAPSVTVKLFCAAGISGIAALGFTAAPAWAQPPFSTGFHVGPQRTVAAPDYRPVVIAHRSQPRHLARRQAHGRGAPVVLRSDMFSNLQSHRVLQRRRPAFLSSRKLGTFGFQPRMLILIDPSQIPLQQRPGVGRLPPRKILVHGGHGLYGASISPRHAALGPGRIPGVHPRLLSGGLSRR